MRKSNPLKPASSRRFMNSWVLRRSAFTCAIGTFAVISTLVVNPVSAQTPANSVSPAGGTTPSPVGHATHSARKSPKPAEPVAPPPPPNWPVLDRPNNATVTWDSRGLRIEASNSSLQQILREVAVNTGAKIEGLGQDQRVYGSYGPGQARDVLYQLLQGSGYNIVLAGDLGQGTPRQIFLSPRHAGAANAPGVTNAPAQDNPDEDVPEDVVEEPPQPPPPPQPQSNDQPGANPNGANPPGAFTPSGPIRTPQQVMEEMQQRQQQQEQQLQQQQGAPQPEPQDQ
jgi:hypothetical protein